MQAGDYKVTAKGGLWERMGPSTETVEVALMPEGAIFKADGQVGEQKTPGGDSIYWAHGTFGGVAGWAAIPYLAPADAQMGASLADIQSAKALEITGQDVALRSDPIISSPAYGAGSNVKAFTNKGEVVAHSGAIQDGFAGVSYKGVSGWMSVLYLVPTNASPTPPNANIVPAPPPSPDDSKVMTEIGPVAGGGAVAVGLLLAAVGIYFLAK